MPRFVDYRCPDCGTIQENIFYKCPEDVSEAINCRCGGEMQRQYGAQIIFDTWTPMTNNAQRDIDHFEKKSKGRLYRQDQTQQSVNHLVNLKEV